MSGMTSGTSAQYADSSKLEARARLLRDFSSAEIGWFSWVARQLHLAPGARILDAGCGPGWFWPEAASVLPRDIELTLLDQSQGMVDEAMERCAPLGLGSLHGVTADAVELPFVDASFDAVIAMHMLYHVADPDAAISEFHRVLRPGGVLLITTNGAENMRELYRLTTVFGSADMDPSALAFDLEQASRLMQSRFGNAALSVHPQAMRVTDQDVIYQALTSYPPGETATPRQQAAFRTAIADAFAAGGGALDVTRQVGAVVSRKQE